MKSYALLVILAVLFAAFGCVEQPASRMYVCDDGKTVVSSLSECPQIDEEYKECASMSAESDYYDESPRDVCFYSLAISRENVSLCSKILSSSEYSEFTRAKCGAMIAIIQGDATECEQFSTSRDRVGCYSTYAYEVEDASICDNITNTRDRDECLYQFIGYYTTPPDGDWLICEKFEDEGYKSNCYYYAAADSFDLSYCDKIPLRRSFSYYTKTECYGNIASEMQEPTICGQLPTQDEQDDCYYSYATDWYEMNVCDYIVNNHTRASCIDLANYSSYWE